MDYSKAVNPADLFSAKGLVIAVTGGGSGIGLAFTTALARSGASRIFILGRRLEPLEAAASSTDPSIVIPIQCDITSPDSLAVAVSAISTKCPRAADGEGYVDVLINNAGIIGPATRNVHLAQSLEEVQAAMVLGIADGGWDQTFRTNATAVMAVSAAFLPLLDRANKRRGWVPGRKEASKGEGNRKMDGGVIAGGPDSDDRRSSQIITVSSISAYNREITGGIAYMASKAASTMLGKSMSHFLAPWNIRSNVIQPGRYPSGMLAPEPNVPVNHIPQGSTGTYEDLASLILYLVGKSGTYVNGAVHTVDGGRLTVMSAST